MPSKNTIRKFVEGGVYHIYNRGVEKRNIFLDEQDYNIFLYYLRTYLTPPDNKKKIPFNILRLGPDFNLYTNIDLLCYALMPNHFHFLIKQVSKDAMTELMKRLTSAYVKYFNDKYKRVGPLFQGRYKSVLVLKDEYLMRLSFYIHTNPVEIIKYSDTRKLEDYSYSSYPDYIGKRNTSWINKDCILNCIEEKNKFAAYEKTLKGFLLDSQKFNKDNEKLKLFLLD